jgi:hypothetical protein
VLSTVALIAVALAGWALARLRVLPAAVRVVAIVLALYAGAAFAIAIAVHAPFAELFHGRSPWARLPTWLQGATVGAFLVVPAGLLAAMAESAHRLGAGGTHRYLARRVLVLGVTLMLAVSSFRGVPAGTANADGKLPATSSAGSPPSQPGAPALAARGVLGIPDSPPAGPAQGATGSGASVPGVPATPPATEPGPPSLPEEIDYWAARLATQIQKGGKEAEPGLLRALQFAGITVRDEQNRVVVIAAKPAQSVAFASAEVAVMARMHGQRMTVPLKDLSDAFSGAIPEFRKAPLAALLLDGIRTHANSDKPAFRFWARFIVELGRRSARPYDLLGKVDPAAVRLDPIQMALMLHRLAADLRLAGGARTPPASFPDPGLTQVRGDGVQSFPGVSDRGRRPALVLAAWHGTVPREEPTQASPRLPGCTWDTARAPSGDEIALGVGYGFGELMDYLAEQGMESAERAGTRLAIANVLLAYVKLVWTMVSLETTIWMDGAGPLIRTPTRAAGEPRKLTALVKMNTGNTQFVNCLRQALNTVGIDIDLPADGPLPEAGVEWDMVQGGTSVDTKGDWAITGPVVEFENSGPRIQDRGAGALAISNFTSNRTNADGEARIGIRGAPQATALTGTLVPVDKQFRIRVNIQVEPPTIRSSVVDAVGVVISPDALLAMPADLLLKSHWASSPTYTFPLTDWEPCAEGWVGTIDVSSEQEKNAGSNSPGGTRSYVNERSYDYSLQESTWAFHGGVTQIIGEGPSHLSIEIPASVVSRFDGNSFYAKDVNWAVECSPKNQTWVPKLRHEVSVSTGSGGCSSTGQARMSSDVKGEYRITGCPPSPCPATTAYLSHMKENEIWCQPGNERQSAYSRQFNIGDCFTIKGQFDPKRPGVIDGTMAEKNMYGRLVKVKWSLRRCQ